MLLCNHRPVVVVLAQRCKLVQVHRLVVLVEHHRQLVDRQQVMEHNQLVDMLAERLAVNKRAVQLVQRMVVVLTDLELEQQQQHHPIHHNNIIENNVQNRRMTWLC